MVIFICRFLLYYIFRLHFHTIDSGVTWQTVSTLSADELPEPAILFDILVDPNNSQRVYVTFFSEGATPESANVIRTDDGGTTWTKINEGSFGGVIHLLTLDPDSDTLYVAMGMLV